MKQSPVLDRLAGRVLRRGLLAALSLSGAAAAAAPSVNVQHPPSPLPTATGRVLVYELNVYNFHSDACARLDDVAVHGGEAEAALALRHHGPVVAANALAYSAAMVPIPHPPGAAQPLDIPPGGGAIVFLHVPLANGKPAPASLRHVLTFTTCTAAAGAPQTVAYDMPLAAAPIVVGLPFQGAGWVAGDSVNAGGTHRRTVIPLRDGQGHPVTGQYHVPERYAIDWVKVDAQAQRAIGAVDQNASYLAYGQEILAVADGVVARTRDGMPDETPPHNPPDPSVDTAAGNYIMQDIGGGHYAFYAHLSPGSLRVGVGERVTRGQVIALLGNSGNSSEPHLHFHVSNSADPLMSEGVPFVFDHFQVTGQVDGMNEASGLFDEYLAHDPLPLHATMPQSFSVLTTEATRPTPPRLRPPPMLHPLGSY